MEAWVGNVIGAAIGFVALMIGAMWNAHLNRRRDDRLRNEERKELLAALMGEVYGLILAVADRRAFQLALADMDDGYGHAEQRLALPSLRVMEKLVDRFGKLGVMIALNAYAVAAQYDLIKMQMQASALDYAAGTLDEDLASHRFESAGSLLGALHGLADDIQKEIGLHDRMKALRDGALAGYYGYVE